MIQRIQSLFLLIVAVVMIVVLFLPLWNKFDVEVMEAVRIDAFSLKYLSIEDEGAETVMATKPTYWIAGLAVLAAGIALFSIFQYKKRLRQIQMGALNSLVMGACLFVTYYYSTVGDKMVAPETIGNFQAGFYIMAMALLCNSLANRYIRRDDRLVKSADRIR